MLSLFKMMFKPTPRWIKEVREGGEPAFAVVLSQPEAVDALRSVGSYKGRDGWIDVPVRVESYAGPPFDADMKCRISQALGGLLEAGTKVNVKYDRNHSQRVLLVDDVNKLLSYRIKE